MNERAIELFKQAGTKAYELCKERGYEVGAIDTIWVSMMAATLSELIVQECILIITEKAEWIHADGTVEAITNLEKHFGVE